jgi:hypothetical protein
VGSTPTVCTIWANDGKLAKPLYLKSKGIRVQLPFRLQKIGEMDNIILLDLDGVMIIHPPWRCGNILEDSFDAFTEESVECLNEIVHQTGYDIILSSSRRLTIDIDTMNGYFKSRGVIKPIKAYMPKYHDVKWWTRVREIEQFLADNESKNYLIIDDDKSLGDLKDKSDWIQTYMSIGLKSESYE